MGKAKVLWEVTPAPHYQPAILPPEVGEKIGSQLGRPAPRTADAVCDLRGERWVVRAGKKSFRVVRGDDGPIVFGDRPRHYASSRLPTLRRPQPQPPEREILLSLYPEVCSGWRMLTDVRFKLLALVPAVSIIAWVQLLKETALNEPPGTWAGVALSLAGLAVTVLLRMYDLRNDQLYDDLISRGRKIEEELGVDTALFRGRPRGVGTRVVHSFALTGIYGVAMLGWVGMALWFTAGLLGFR
ncbi:MAG TPA: hypothetical protein VF092_16300 [Longimicrobium sp.]